ncbi:MAG TPA: DUF4147 domain-containing protein [Fimbriimonadaceae bacterium]|nr:DUF4147 domain-containing protein [Fimbriimonadaceae bacterium]
MTIIRTKAQEAVVRIFQETIRTVRADALVGATCWRDGRSLYLAGSEYPLPDRGRVLILGAGKASAAMAQGIEALLDGIPVEGLVVTKYGHSQPTRWVEVMEAGHPIPDDNSLIAGERMMALARAATGQDLVIVLLSGGASSLMESLADGVCLRDLQLITESLLKSGANIQQLNAVRSCLSRLKAGGLARACGSPRLVCLLLSDVIGNAREVVGSGPCWGAPPSGEKASEVLRKRRVPVQESISEALGRVPSLDPAYPEHLVLGDIFTLLEAAQKAAEGLGLKPKVYGRPFSGEARDVGARMAAEALTLYKEIGRYDCVLAAGETTVTVRGQGLGGRNQELACAAALALDGISDIALLAAGTDGTDGPTEAAGGLIDGDTAGRTNLRRALTENDCYHALEAADALITTGPTQTNLNDLVVIARIQED